MFCENCGKTLPEGAKFCSSCGAKTIVTDEPVSIENIEEVKNQPEPEKVDAEKPRQVYTPPAYMQTPQEVNKAPLSVGQYLGMFLLMCIPLVNLILLLIWAFSGDINVNKKNFAKATLILAVIGIILSILITVGFSSIIAILFSELQY